MYKRVRILPAWLTHPNIPSSTGGLGSIAHQLRGNEQLASVVRLTAETACAELEADVWKQLHTLGGWPQLRVSAA